MEHGLLSVYMSQAVQSFMLVNTNSPHAPFFMCQQITIYKSLSGGDKGNETIWDSFQTLVL